MLSSQGFYESIVLISDGHDFIDHICFEFGLLECPEKLYDLLTAPLNKATAKPLLEVSQHRAEICEFA
jgi:hypothetical protein